jgi:hypothetical protein
MPKLEEFTAYRYRIGTDPQTGDPVYRTFEDKASAIRSMKRYETTSAKKEEEFQQWLRDKMEEEGVTDVRKLLSEDRPKRIPEDHRKDEEYEEEAEGEEVPEPNPIPRPAKRGRPPMR